MDGAIPDEWGRVFARCESRDRPIGAMDALIAAAAQVHGLTAVTRNVAEFQPSVKSVFSPRTWPDFAESRGRARVRR